ncbi:tetratricopeptide repeat protein [Actinoplanes sp. NPDC051513]|uniref:tetratricopeptide repeat protein n=1 Tax=Actinoplanes sp. NPDC051513 TaxID=3363908 RepID=UPI0037B15709
MSYAKAAASRWSVVVVLGLIGLVMSTLVLLTVFLLGEGLDKADKWASIVGGYVAAASLLAAGSSWLIRRATRRSRKVDGDLLGAGWPSAPAGVFGSASLVAPAADAAPCVRGRDQHLQRLHRAARRPAGRVQVLTGLGGVGKSTLALEMCRRFARSKERTAWWVSATDISSLADGLASLAGELGADHVHLMAIRSGAPRARERLWELLRRARPGWLLVFDNVDDPRTVGVLRDSGLARCADRGLVLVTSRINQERLWGNDAEVVEVALLAEDDAAQVLVDMAPDAGDHGDARRLARDLGYLPLALHHAGTSLGSPFALWSSFDGYREALNELGLDRVLTTSRRMGHEADHRRSVKLTWEMSLTALAEHGLPQCRPLLRLLSYYSVAAPIPENLLHADPVRAVVGCDGSADALDVRRRVQEGLEGLADQSLIAKRDVPGPSGRERVLTLHPLVAETIRANTDGAVRTGTPPPDSVAPVYTAVELVTVTLEPLRFDDNKDWYRFGLLAPHVHALLRPADTHLDRDHLAQLVTATAHVVASYAWSGLETAAETLADEGLKHAGRLGETHPSTLHLRSERAWAIGRHGRWEQAQAELQRVLDARSQSLGAEHPDTLDTRHKLAWAAGRLGDWRAAEAQLRAVLDARVEVLGDEQPDTLHTRCCLAWAVGQCGRHEEAETAYHDVISTRERVLGKDHVETLDARHSLAELYVRHRRFRDAEQILQKIIKDRLRLLGSRHPETLDSRPRYWLARALRGQGRHREADRILRRLLEDQIQYLDPHHPAIEATRQQLRTGSGPHKDHSATPPVQ